MAGNAAGHSTEFTLLGHGGTLVARRWEAASPRWIAVLVHGYGEHIGRYEYVADRLTRDEAVVYGLDHVGHGKSDGERVLIEDFEPVVADVKLLEDHARSDHPDLPVVLIGHSMGGMIAARYAQRFGGDLVAVVLSGPVLGSWIAVDSLLGVDDIPDDPIDPSTLSRDETVGEAYVADPLVWHGPFKKPTIEALDACLKTITAAGPVDSVPVQWLHGEDDQLVPIEASRQGWSNFRGAESEQKTYVGARHEIFNETNRDEVLDDAVGFIERHLPI